MLTALEKRVIREQATKDSLFKEVCAVMAGTTNLYCGPPIQGGGVMSEDVSGEGDTTSMATVKPSKRKAAATTLGSSDGPHTRRRVDTIRPKVDKYSDT